MSGVLKASLWLGLVGAALGLVTYALLRHGAMREFSPGMAIALMSALPFALAWWIVPAIPLAREEFEAYARLTVSAPLLCVLLVCPALALAAGEPGAVVGFGVGWAPGRHDRDGLGAELGAPSGRRRRMGPEAQRAQRRVVSVRVPG